jgi:hypothetical protein
MVAAFGRHETVFTVLGDAARRRHVRGLVLQLIVSVAIASAILVSAPNWWSLAFLAGWSAAYSAWGLLSRFKETRNLSALNALLVTIAALGTALAVAGIIGVGLAFYTGDAGGAKTTCGKNSTNKHCQAPSPAQGPIRLP